MVAQAVVSEDSQNRGLSPPALLQRMAPHIEMLAAILGEPQLVPELRTSLVKMAQNPERVRLVFTDSGHRDRDVRAGVRAQVRARAALKSSSAPPDLVRLVLRLARAGGMREAELGRVLGGDGRGRAGRLDTGQAWHRYYVKRSPMRAGILRSVIWSSVERGWIDHGWIDADQPARASSLRLRERSPLEVAPLSPRLLMRLDAAQAASHARAKGVALNETHIHMLSLQVMLEAGRAARIDPRGFAQSMRRAHERATSAPYWVRELVFTNALADMWFARD